MARTILRDVAVTVGGVDLSSRVRAVAVTTNTPPIDVTKFGDLAHVYRPGLRDDVIELELYQDFAASVHSVLQPLIGSSVGATVRVTPVRSAASSAANPTITMVGVPLTYSPLDGGVGAASLTKVAFKPAAGSYVTYTYSNTITITPALEYDSTDCEVDVVEFDFDIALGRLIGYCDRVKNGDPSTSRIGILALAAAGLESDEVLRVKATVAAVLAGTTNEVTNSGYSRITCTGSDLTITVDNTNHWTTADAIDKSFGTAVAAGDQFAKTVFYYDPNPATSTDATRIPLTCNSGIVVPDGTAIPVSIQGFAKAAAG